VKRALGVVLSLMLMAPLSGCLGTVVETPTPEGKPITTTNVHILAAPFRVDAHVCKRGMSRVVTFVPLWGVAVGILTFGILVPKTSMYHCVGGR
jgi:hypothetical protein